MRPRTGSRVRAALALLAAAAVARPALAAAQDDAEVSASVDTEEVALDGLVTLQISVTTSSKGETADLSLPPLRDFDVVSRSQSEQVSFQFVGGAPSFRRTIVYSVALTPHRQGKATIEAASVVYRGKRFQTQPITVRVFPPGKGPKANRRQAAPGAGMPDPFGAPDPFGDAPAAESEGATDPFRGVHPGSRDLLLRATVDVEKPFVGQQITYTLWLLSRVNVSGIDKLSLPRLDGFWTEEVEAPQQLVGEARIIDGVPYRAYMLRKRALFALRPGKVPIDPADVEVLTGFGMLFSRSSARRQSQAITLEVQPLPPGKPVGFDAGNVGEWQLSASAEPATAAVGQAITFRLQASGRGNVRDLALPRLPAIPGLRAYDATTTDKSQTERGQIGGTRTIEQLLVPERSGEFRIPTLSLETFDPVARQYKTVRTQPITIAVRAGAPGQARGGQNAGASAQNLLAAGGLRPIRLQLTRVAPSQTPPWTRGFFWPLFALGPLAAAAAFLASRARRALAGNQEGRRVRDARSAARKRLRGAEALLSPGRAAPRAQAQAFYAEVARALTQYLADKRGVAAAGLTRPELSLALASHGLPAQTVERLLAALDECDRARFAPGADEPAAQHDLLARADRILAELDRGQQEAA